METFVKQAEDSIALSVALVSSFVISSFKKYTPATPALCPVNVARTTTIQAIVNKPEYSNYQFK